MRNWRNGLCLLLMLALPQGVAVAEESAQVYAGTVVEEQAQEYTGAVVEAEAALAETEGAAVEYAGAAGEYVGAAEEYVGVALMEEELGCYAVPDGWLLDEEAEGTVYRNAAYENSVIVCAYLDTNYATSDYEQLRQMLTNNLLYSHVSAQLSTTAGYTEAKDYLFAVVVDDATEDFEETYYYVVGDYCCFCVQVQEYRAEAGDETSPTEVGKSIAEGFVWN